MAGEVQIDRRIPAELQPAMTGASADPQAPQEEPSYYDVSMLQPPVWEGHLIAPYFFLGGLAGGAYLMSRVAEWAGGDEYRDVTRAGSTIALLATLPCAPLLIADLGDPTRFHHMLRVFKPQSPMSLGAWTLTGFSAAAAASVFREWRRGKAGAPRGGAGRALDRSLTLMMDAAGVPLALLMTCYTGVLLSGSAAPTWCKNKWLAPLFASSAIGNGAGAIGLALQFLRKRRWLSRQTPGERALKHIDTVAHVAETIFLVQYLVSLGKLNKPLTAGKQRGWLGASVAANMASELLKYLPANGKPRRRSEIAAACAGLASGLLLKYAIFEAGKSSASDPQAARMNTRRRSALPSKFPRPIPPPQPPPAPAKILNL
jgi:formate-dependent nitrite reductase membrane component NrfD